MLEPVTKGLRLVLAFNLVRGAQSADLTTTAASVTAHRHGFEEVLTAAAKEWCADAAAVEKFVIPLSHEYTPTNVSFSGLKGSDLRTAKLLQTVCNPATNEKLFSVYLALVTKHETGTEDEGGGYHGGSGGMSGDCDVETEYDTTCWVGPNGAVDLGGMSVDFSSEILTAQGEEDDEEEMEAICEGIFGSDPDREQREGYCGNYAGSLEYWYHSAVLVFWPTARDFEIKLAANPTQAITLLQDMDRTSPDFASKLTVVLNHLNRGGGVVWQPHTVLPLLQSAEHAKFVFRMCERLILKEEDARAVVTVVEKFGLTTLHTAFTSLVRSQSLKMAVVLLKLAKQHLGFEPPADMASSSTVEATRSWSDFVGVLVAKVLDSACSGESDTDLVIVCNFIVTHCEMDDQLSVATHLSTHLKLKSMNHLIADVICDDGDDGDERHGKSFQDQLKQYAVLQCMTKAVPPSDLVEVVDWIVRGEHTDLMTTLHPRLLGCVNSPQVFRKLFALPAVVLELKTVSSISRELETLIGARITEVSPHTTAPPFTWAMPGAQNTASDQRVGPFLHSPNQQMQLYGFNGIAHARNWAHKYFSSGGFVSAVASGTGQNANVALTKNRSHHDGVVKKCAENQSELDHLRRLLKVRDSSAVTSSNSVMSATSDQPVDKRMRVEGDVSTGSAVKKPIEVIVID